MPRGGHRKGSGRKSTWISGCKFVDTKLIRVPESLADELIEIAHKLDAGEKLETVTKSNDVSQLELFNSWQTIDFEELDKNLERKFISSMKQESKLGEGAKAFKAAKKAFREVLKSLREKLD
jgi:hypothetical protein